MKNLILVAFLLWALSLKASDDFYFFKVSKGQSLSGILYSLGIKPYLNNNIQKYIQLNQDILTIDGKTFYDTEIKIPVSDIVFEENFDINENGYLTFKEKLIKKDTFDNYSFSREVEQFESSRFMSAPSRRTFNIKSMAYSFNSSKLSAGTFTRYIDLSTENENASSTQEFQGRYELEFDFVGRNNRSELRRRLGASLRLDYMGGVMNDLDMTYKAELHYSRLAVFNQSLDLGIFANYQGLSFRQNLALEIYNNRINFITMGPRLEYRYKQASIVSKLGIPFAAKDKTIELTDSRGINFTASLNYLLTNKFGLSGTYEFLSMKANQYSMTSRDFLISGNYTF